MFIYDGHPRFRKTWSAKVIIDGQVREEFVFSLWENVEVNLKRIAPGVNCQVTKKDGLVTIYVNSIEYMKGLKKPKKKLTFDMIIHQLKNLIEKKET